MNDCPVCAKPEKYRRGVTLECVDCCVRWLDAMESDEERRINAPIILYATNAAHMDAVRAAYRYPVDRRQKQRQERRQEPRGITQ